MGDGRFWMFALSGSAAKGGPFGVNSRDEMWLAGDLWKCKPPLLNGVEEVGPGKQHAL